MTPVSTSVAKMAKSQKALRVAKHVRRCRNSAELELAVVVVSQYSPVCGRKVPWSMFCQILANFATLKKKNYLLFGVWGQKNRLQAATMRYCSWSTISAIFRKLPINNGIGNLRMRSLDLQVMWKHKIFMLLQLLKITPQESFTQPVCLVCNWLFT